MTHFLGCPGPDISVMHAVTFDLVTCRACHASAKVARTL